MTSTVKQQISFLSSLAQPRRVAVPIMLKQTRCNGMDSVWDTFKYSHKRLVISWQVKVIRGHQVKKIKVNILRLVGTIQILM